MSTTAGAVALGRSLLAHRVKLNDGKLIPVIGLGVYQSDPGEETYQTVLGALKLGYRHVDTARFYANEADVGKAVRDSGVPREEIFVTTKIWMDDQGYDATLREGRRSNELLGLGYIDLLILHCPFEQRVASYQALEQLQKEGVVQSIGVSNFNVNHLEQLMGATKVVPAVNQIELHPFLQRREVVSFCKKHGIVLEAYSPLAKAKRMKDPRLVEIAKSHHCTPAQVLLRWGLAQGFIILPKSTRPERQAENAALENVQLSAEAKELLTSMEEHLVTGWDPLTWK
jgi:diketogulonate reductase-like aldo/keto reductase